MKISRIVYSDGKPEWRQRFEYAGAALRMPVLIARPSVVDCPDPKTKLMVRTVVPGNVVTEVLTRDDALRPA